MKDTPRRRNTKERKVPLRRDFPAEPPGKAMSTDERCRRKSLL